jgi:hypothetical protein
MKYKYTYKNKKTGQKINTNNSIESDDWELIVERKDGMMRSEDKNVIQKNGR